MVGQVGSTGGFVGLAEIAPWWEGSHSPCAIVKTTPNVRVKHLSRRAAFINLASPGDNPTARSRGKRKDQTPRERGYFLDLKTLAAALTSQSHSLDSLAAFLEIPGKTDFRDFGREIDGEFIRYAVNERRSRGNAT